MSFVRTVKRTATALIAPTVFMALTGYFCWNATRGAHGLEKFGELQARLKKSQVELASAEAERDRWENRVGGLRDKHVDPDTLDERARAMLNLADPNDLVVMYGPGKDLFP
jgi:cell division protein FtsB